MEGAEDGEEFEQAAEEPQAEEEHVEPETGEQVEEPASAAAAAAAETTEAIPEPTAEAGEIEEDEYEEEVAPESATQAKVEEPDILELRSRNVVQSGGPVESTPLKAAPTTTEEARAKTPAPEPEAKPVERTPAPEETDVISLRNRDVLQSGPAPSAPSPNPSAAGGDQPKKATPAPITWTPSSSAVKRKADGTPEGAAATPATGEF